VPRLVFPVVAKVHYTDDFGAPRWQGRHQGNDIMAAKRSPVVAVEPGRVVKWSSSRSAGCMLYLYGRSGTTYMYVHLNNDRTLRNDNRGGCRNGISYAPGLVSGQTVQAGQLIGFVGDSGDANGIASHLHFEVHPDGGRARSPFRHLNAAFRHVYGRPRPTEETISMRIRGSVYRVRTDLDPQRIRIRIAQVLLSNGWVVKPARHITLAVPPEAILRRTVEPGAYSTATLADFEVGRLVTAWTTEFPQTLGAARAAPIAHAISDLLLRLERR